MSVTINVNGLSLVHRGSGGVSKATLPDFCRTPGNAAPVPYPNVAFSRDLADGTTSISADGGHMCAKYGSRFATSIGDAAGTLRGVKSGTVTAEATWLTYSFDVMLEGQGACRLTDKMYHNGANTVNMGGELQAPVPRPPSDPACARLYQLIYDLIWRERPPTTPGSMPDGVKGLAWRWQEYAQNRGGWTSPGRNADNHLQEYIKQRTKLREYLDQWRNKKKRDCNDDDLPPGTPEYASEQLPELGPGKPVTPTPETSAFREHLRTIGVVVAGAGALVIAAIIISRIIRLAPPLWPLQLSPI
ncbi:MAG: DUF4150 domain-containing protein [Gemmatimonadaceae bacterium]|jgi:hypothetical protein|nr:DUF4150 domain-containing protein [Gemmatimonadaceae bacterium]